MFLFGAVWAPYAHHLHPRLLSELGSLALQRRLAVSGTDKADMFLPRVGPIKLSMRSDE